MQYVVTMTRRALLLCTHVAYASPQNFFSVCDTCTLSATLLKSHICDVGSVVKAAKHFRFSSVRFLCVSHVCSETALKKSTMRLLKEFLIMPKCLAIKSQCWPWSHTVSSMNRVYLSLKRDFVPRPVF